MGNVQYIGWRMEFCCKRLLVDDLQQLAKMMEHELEEWNKTVSHARDNFYELNYYTTRQLLILRSELGKIKSSGLDSRLPYVGQVMTLLKSLSSEITPPALEGVVNIISIECNDIEERENSPQTDEMHPLNSTSSPAILSPHTKVVEHNIGKGDHIPRSPTISLSRETLTEKQESHCTDIIENFEFSEKTALKAIEAVDDGDWNDIVNWIEENGEEWERKFNECQESEEEEEIEDVDTDEDSEDMYDQERDNEMPQRDSTSMFCPIIL